jgi:predicted branched-subunit amino acid permease
MGAGMASKFTSGRQQEALDTVGLALPVAFGISFGTAATEVGLEAWLVVGMSATIFAGTSQFAVLDLWQA